MPPEAGFSKQCVDYKEYGRGFNRFLPASA